MATTFPTLSVGFDISSKLKTNARLNVLTYGDGYASRTPDGINYKARTYTIVFRALGPSDRDILVPFLEEALDGRSVEIPLYNIDASGSTRAYFTVESYDLGHDSSGYLTDVTIQCREVFDA